MGSYNSFTGRIVNDEFKRKQIVTFFERKYFIYNIMHMVLWDIFRILLLLLKSTIAAFEDISLRYGSLWDIFRILLLLLASKIASLNFRQKTEKVDITSVKKWLHLAFFRQKKDDVASRIWMFNFWKFFSIY